MYVVYVKQFDEVRVVKLAKACKISCMTNLVATRGNYKRKLLRHAPNWVTSETLPVETQAQQVAILCRQNQLHLA